MTSMLLNCYRKQDSGHAPWDFHAWPPPHASYNPNDDFRTRPRSRTSVSPVPKKIQDQVYYDSQTHFEEVTSRDQFITPDMCSPEILTRKRPLSVGDIHEIRTVKIIGYSQTSAGVWEFSIDVVSPLGTKVLTASSRGRVPVSKNPPYTIRRRFSEFRRLYHRLQLAYPDHTKTLPSLPESGVLSKLKVWWQQEAFLCERAAQLQQLLEAISGNVWLASSDEFLEFLGKNPITHTTGYVTLSRYDAPSSTSGFSPRTTFSMPSSTTSSPRSVER